MASQYNVINQNIKRLVWPPVPQGSGYNSRLARRIKSLDVANGFDRTMGKRRVIRPKGRQAMAMKIHSSFTYAEGSGGLVGHFPRQYGQLFDGYA